MIIDPTPLRISAGETANRFFDFTNQLASGETLSAASVTASVYAPAGATETLPTISDVSVSGSQVLLQISGSTVAGVTYLLAVTVTTSTSESIPRGVLLLVE